MIEVALAGRIIRRGVLVGPVVVAVAWLLSGPETALSAGLGVALTLANLWVAARVIGGVAENNPQLLLPAGLGALALGLILVTGASLALLRIEAVSFPVMGVTLVVSHLVLVLWEAAGAYGHVKPVPGAAPAGRSSRRS